MTKTPMDAFDDCIEDAIRNGAENVADILDAVRRADSGYALTHPREIDQGLARLRRAKRVEGVAGFGWRVTNRIHLCGHPAGACDSDCAAEAGERIANRKGP